MFTLDGSFGGDMQRCTITMLTASPSMAKRKMPTIVTETIAR